MGPIFFGPGAKQPPTYRFDSASSAFGVLYAGWSFSAALVETLLRNPARKMVAYEDIERRALSQVSSRRDLRLARLHGDGLQQVGCDNSISTGPYDICGLWADALWNHPDKPDGIAYLSRHDSSEICFALFERADIDLDAGPPNPLIHQLAAVTRVLLSHGKSISVLPG